MTIQQYITLLNDQKDKAEQRFSTLNSFENVLIDTAFNYLLDNLDLKAGSFEIPEGLPQIMDDFVFTLVGVAVKNRDYQSALNKYLIDLETIKTGTEKLHKDQNNINIKPVINTVQKAVTDEIINQYTENGLNVNFAAPLRDIMFNNILSGMNQQEARQYLRDYIKGGKDQSGKLKSYLNQTAMMGVDSYSGAINMKVAASFDFTGYVISGSIIKTSSKQCRFAIETSEAGYLSFEEWRAILKMAEENKRAPLIEGTTLDNLPINKLHWGCRHDFTPTNN